MNSMPFTSATGLEQTFAEGLAQLLGDCADLGVYILTLANAAHEPGLWARLHADLARCHARHAEEITAGLRQGRRLQAPEDDLLVFLKLMAIGFQQVCTTIRRRAGPWGVQFNPMRALRPPRASSGRVEGLRRPFDPAGFHFNKPFLAREVLWAGSLAAKPVRLLYNKFPLVRLHGLLVPEPEARRPQWLTPEMHAWAWEVVTALGRDLPDLGLAYNSLGAQASVNHLHFQSFVAAPSLPLLAPGFTHNGGSRAYPLPCLVADGVRESWLLLDDLQQRATPYNLVYTPGRVHILPRRPQGGQDLPAWCAGLAWSELAGEMTVFSREDYETLTEPEIVRALSAMRP
ncbi:MAG TPA: hypothetical protein PKH69_11195 [Thiobacillaceae bacterium]|nr:hypothetical protein [Thiobacillaceae bacterium]HNU65034.1 hypothetical protein [Thiobacillaceae bacterium]